MISAAPISLLLTYVLLPVWILAGFTDYLCHRATNIEHANGANESLTHWLMLGEIGVPLAAATFLKINSLLLIFFVLCIVAHELTTHWDLQIAIRTRRVTAFEQQVHSVLEGAPLAALFLLMLLHWPQVQAIFGQGQERADFGLTLDLPTNWYAVAGIFAVSVIFLLLPYADEFARGLRVKRKV